MKAVTPIVVATVGIILVAAFLVPAVGLLGGGGDSPDPPGPSYLTYTNEGQAMTRITPETTPTINVAVTPTGVSINGAEREIAGPAIVAMSKGMSSKYPGLYILYDDGSLTISATLINNSSTSISSLSSINITAQGGHWYYTNKELAGTEIYIVSDTGDYVNVPMGTAAYVPTDDKVATGYLYGSQVSITYFDSSEYVGYYNGTVEDVPGAVKLTLADNDIGKVVCTLAPKSVVTDIETEPEPVEDEGSGIAWAGPVLVTLMMVAILMIFVKTIGRTD